jgi:hypothetical protein
LQLTDERKKRVIDLYFNQHKTYAEIVQIERISPRDINAIIKEEKARRQKHKQQEVCVKAYKLFSEGKTPVQVAFKLNLREPEVTRMFIEYSKLNRLHKFYLVCIELGDEGIGDFLKLYKLAKKEGIGRKHVVKLLQLADQDNAFGLSQLEKRCKWLIDKIYELDMQIERSKNYLYRLKSEIASCKQLLNSYHIWYECKRQESELLNKEISRLEALVSRFKTNNEEYLKIEQTVEEKVSSVLTDGKVLLQFALAVIIEALRRNPDKYNDLLIDNTSTTMPTQQSSSSHVENYRDMILDEASRLYDRLLKYFTDSIMNNAAFKIMLLRPSPAKLPSQHNDSDSYRLEEPESFHDSKGDIAD